MNKAFAFLLIAAGFLLPPCSTLAVPAAPWTDYFGTARYPAVWGSIVRQGTSNPGTLEPIESIVNFAFSKDNDFLLLLSEGLTYRQDLTSADVEVFVEGMSKDHEKWVQKIEKLLKDIYIYPFCDGPVDECVKKNGAYINEGRKLYIQVGNEIVSEALLSAVYEYRTKSVDPSFPPRTTSSDIEGISRGRCAEVTVRDHSITSGEFVYLHDIAQPEWRSFNDKKYAADVIDLDTFNLYPVSDTGNVIKRCVDTSGVLSDYDPAGTDPGKIDLLKNYAPEAVAKTANINWMAEYYAENFLVPAVEAIKRFKAGIPESDAANVYVVLGSINNTRNLKNRQFLYALLNYKIKDSNGVGDYEKDPGWPAGANNTNPYRNRYVFELVDYATAHYVFSADNLYQRMFSNEFESLSSEMPRRVMDELYKGIVSPGNRLSRMTDSHPKKVDGIMISEEVANPLRKMRAASSGGIKVFSRFMHWLNNLTDDNYGPISVGSDRAKLLHWGWLGRYTLPEPPYEDCEPAPPEESDPIPLYEPPPPNDEAWGDVFKTKDTGCNRITNEGDTIVSLGVNLDTLRVRDPNNVNKPSPYGNKGHTSGEAMETVYDFFCGSRLFEVSAPQESPGGNVPHVVHWGPGPEQRQLFSNEEEKPRLETYVFRNEDDTRRAVVMYDHLWLNDSQKNAVRTQEDFYLSSFRFLKGGGRNDWSGDIGHKILMFSQWGKTNLNVLYPEPAIVPHSDSWEFVWNNEFGRPHLRRQAAIVGLFCIDVNDPACGEALYECPE